MSLIISFFLPVGDDDADKTCKTQPSDAIPSQYLLCIHKKKTTLAEWPFFLLVSDDDAVFLCV